MIYDPDIEGPDHQKAAALRGVRARSLASSFARVPAGFSLDILVHVSSSVAPRIGSYCPAFGPLPNEHDLLFSWTALPSNRSEFPPPGRPRLKTTTRIVLAP